MADEAAEGRLVVRQPSGEKDTTKDAADAPAAADASRSAEEEALAAFHDNSLFSLRRPRNAGSGAASAVKSVLKGVTVGAVGLVAAPVMGAREGGAKGFFQGLGVGVASIVALPVAGTIIGCVQLARGVLNTPEAIRERSLGKVWDEDTRRWVVYDLREEAYEILSLTEEEWCAQHGVKVEANGGRHGGRRNGSVAETELYDALGVASDATPAQIKRAYYQKAKQMHPDKNRGDPEAHLKFQAVGEAYQVLSNDELREKYDKSGKQALEVELVDPSAFFAALFGSEAFEYLVGELKIATTFAQAADLESIDERWLEYKQRRREVLCAVTLRDLLQQAVLGDTAEFAEEMHAHAQVLKEAPFGEALLWTCGYVYEHKGLQALGGVDAMASEFYSSAHSAASHMRVASTAFRTYRAYKKDSKSLKQDKSSDTGEKKADAEAEATPKQTSTRGPPAGAEGKPYAQGEGHSEATADGESKGEGGGDSKGEGKDEGEGKENGASNSKETREGDAKGAKKGEAAHAEPGEQTTLLMLESMWRVSLLDIESTLRHVCNKVLSDRSTDLSVKAKRAQALVTMGRIFKQYGSADALKHMDLKGHLESVNLRLAERAAAANAERDAAQ